MPLEAAEAAGGPLHTPDKPVPVLAYIEVNDTIVRVEGTAVRWNSRVVDLMWTGIGDEPRRALVWANAVSKPTS